jgi:hypothetical protein
MENMNPLDDERLDPARDLVLGIAVAYVDYVLQHNVDKTLSRSEIVKAVLKYPDQDIGVAHKALDYLVDQRRAAEFSPGNYCLPSSVAKIKDRQKTVANSPTMTRASWNNLNDVDKTAFFTEKHGIIVGANGEVSC